LFIQRVQPWSVRDSAAYTRNSDFQQLKVRLLVGHERRHCMRSPESTTIPKPNPGAKPATNHSPNLKSMFNFHHQHQHMKHTLKLLRGSVWE
jgi:hypothetical protein